MSEKTEGQPGRQRKFSPVRLSLTVLISAAIVIYLFPPEYSRHWMLRVKCMANLKSLGDAMNRYAEEHGMYPPPKSWCDLLAGRYVSEETLRCPAGKDNRCDYAMNPDADPCSPHDTVLLFESRPGWNQFGGSELRTFRYHKGFNVLFVNGVVRFVTPDEAGGLKWRDDDVPDANLAGDWQGTP